MDREQLREWFAEVNAYICADETGKLTIDKLAQELQIRPNDRSFVPKCTEMLASTEKKTQDQARKLLREYVAWQPDDVELSMEDWTAWWNENRDGLRS